MLNKLGVATATEIREGDGGLPTFYCTLTWNNRDKIVLCTFAKINDFETFKFGKIDKHPFHFTELPRTSINGSHLDSEIIHS